MSIIFKDITKRYGDTVAVNNVSLSIEPNEFFFLIGPSGCGKTTLLRILAGFCKPDSGAISLFGRDITSTPPEKRNTTMVFQNYALWPHMSVMQNICFGLEQRGISKPQRAERAARVLDIIRMNDKADSQPGELSGGQQQRVALARALVVEPDAVLLDEPLSNLDAKLRNEMRREILRIQRETGVTMLYVTHDQKEALSMGDRIAVMNAGQIEQIGTPEDLYASPSTRFVAEFMGSSNVIPGRCVERRGSEITVDTPIGRLAGRSSDAVEKNTEVTCIIRPERVSISQHGDATANGILSSHEFLGETSELTVKCGDTSVRLMLTGSDKIPAIGSPVDLKISPSDILIFRN